MVIKIYPVSEKHIPLDIKCLAPKPKIFSFNIFMPYTCSQKPQQVLVASWHRGFSTYELHIKGLRQHCHSVYLIYTGNNNVEIVWGYQVSL